jgi:nucleoside-diphosphate-sugar epimerase
MAKEAGVERFLFSSSCSLYGASGDKLVDESAEFAPVTPYALSKVYSERDLAPLADDSFSPTYLRNGTVYGMSPRIRFDLVVNNLTAWALATRKVCLKSDGKPWRPLVHVADVCHAFVVVLNAPRELIHNEAFNVGVQNENYQIRDVAELVRLTVPNSEVSFAADACPDTRCYKVDFSKIYNTLPDYKPRWTVPAGVLELYRAYSKLGVALEEFEGCRYKRIDHIQMLQREGFINNDLRLQQGSVSSVSAR